MKLELMTDLYLEELRDVYDAEKQLLRALPKMAKAATAPELKKAFQTHEKETRQQAQRLERIFKRYQEKPTGKRCVGMEGLIEEAQEMLEEDVSAEVLDVALVVAAQKVEHYEIASYGSLATFAKLLGLREDLRLLVETLNEEKATDGKLTLIAEFGINIEAAEEELETDEVSYEEMAEAEGDSRNGSQQPRSKRLRSQKGGGKQARSRSGRQSQRGGGGRMTTDLDEIREWAEARGGTPAAVKGTSKKNDPGVLRIDFPGYSGADSLKKISWDEWYAKFQENNLRFLYQDRTKGGKESRFFKLICEPAKK